jgi:branched-subunit amino acid transport protein
MTYVIVVIVGMTLVTYLPRSLPLLFRSRGRLSERQIRALRLIPVTAIGALVIPGGFVSVDGRIGMSAVGLAAAVALSLFARHPFVVVVGSVGAVALAIMLG